MSMTRNNAKVRGVVGLSLLMTITSCKFSKESANNGELVAFDSDYKQIIARAASLASRDALSQNVHRLEIVKLGTSPIKVPFKVAIGETGRLAVLDPQCGGVYLFEHDGRLISQLGEHGRGPGKYLTPAALASTPEGFVVVDFTDHRVNIFDEDGHFRRSFIYTAQAFSSTGILHDKMAGVFYLFGNRWRHDPSRSITTADLLNIYDNDGTFVHSQFPFPPQWLPFHLMSADAPITTSDEADIGYFALPFEPILHRIDRKVTTVSDLSLDLPGFTAPTKPLPEDLRQLRNFRSWELEYTPIRAVAVCRGKLWIEYETHHGLRYSLAVLQPDTGKALSIIETNYLMVGSQSNGLTVFVNNPGAAESGSKEITYGYLDE